MDHNNAYLRRRVLPLAAGGALLYVLLRLAGVSVNAVALTIVLMIAFCLLKMPVAIALFAAAVLGGLHAGLGMPATLEAINGNLLAGAQVGMTYVMVGAFALALSRSGLLELLAERISARLHSDAARSLRNLKWLLFGLFALASLLSQNLVPVHIAFIPILIPPLLGVMNRLHIDRRAAACIIACMISSSYLLLPFGFGAIYLNEILLSNINQVGAAQGLAVTAEMAPKAMFWPVMGIVAGMLVAVLISYRRTRRYHDTLTLSPAADAPRPALNLRQLAAVLLALAAALLGQMLWDSLLFGAMLGFMVLSVAGIFRWQAQDDVFNQGLRLMAQIAVIITMASGFAGLLGATGDIEPLVQSVAAWIGDNRILGAGLMLLVGLFITIGFGDSFASVPILAPIYIPLAAALGFSPLASMALLGAAAALGDAGSPASTITLGATAGLNADGQHDHIKDSVIPTFIHANFGMLLFAWVAVQFL